MNQMPQLTKFKIFVNVEAKSSPKIIISCSYPHQLEADQNNFLKFL